MTRPRRAMPKQPKVAQPVWASSGVCPACEKRIYTSKKAARQAARVHHPHDNLSAYQCRSTSDRRPTPAPWHIGHLVEEIKTGDLARDDRYEHGILASDGVECNYFDKSGLKCSLGPGHNPAPHLAQTISGEWINIDPHQN